MQTTVEKLRTLPAQNLIYIWNAYQFEQKLNKEVHLFHPDIVNAVFNTPMDAINAVANNNRVDTADTYFIMLQGYMLTFSEPISLYSPIELGQLAYWLETDEIGKDIWSHY